MKKLLFVVMAAGGPGAAWWLHAAGQGGDGRPLAAALIVGVGGLLGLAGEFLLRPDRRPLSLRAADRVEDVLGRLSRAVLVLTVLAVLAAAAGAVALFWPMSGVVAALLALGAVCKAKAPNLWSMGAASWCSFRGLVSAQMIGGDRGLILGRPARHCRPGFGQAVKALLFWPARRSAAAVALFLGALRLGAGRRTLVRLPQAIHTAVFAPAGAGKSTGFVIPFLLDCPDSCVVLDYKGELAKATAAHRRRTFGHRVVLLDPFRLVTQRPDTFNPLDFILADDRAALDFCRQLAESLVVRGEERELHWLDSAEEWIGAMCAAVVAFGPKGDRSLQTVKEILSDPAMMKQAIDMMRRSDAWGGLLARMGHGLTHFVDRELGSALTTSNRFLRFLSTPAMVESTRASSFDPHELNLGKSDVFLCIPFEHSRPLAGLMRLWVSSMLRAVVRGGPQEKNLIHFVLDETANLLALPSLEDAIVRLRGHGVRAQLYFQALSQADLCFPNGQAQTLLANTTSVFLGTNDISTANYISQRCGSQTIQVANTSKQTSYSYSGTNFGEPPHPPQYSTSDSTGFNQQARELLKPDEVLRLPRRTAITFPPEMPPVVTELVPYFKAPWLRRSGPLSRLAGGLGTLLKAAAVLAAVAGLAGLLAAALLDAERRQPAPDDTTFPHYAPAPGRNSNQWR